MPLPTPLDADELLDRDFLEMRAMLLQVAASLDRIYRADGTVDQDPRIIKLHKALEVLQGVAANRAERIQMVFSREYEPGWREDFEARPRIHPY